MTARRAHAHGPDAPAVPAHVRRTARARRSPTPTVTSTSTCSATTPPGSSVTASDASSTRSPRRSATTSASAASTRQRRSSRELMCERFDLDRVRFTNSGTEANLMAITTAMQATGRRKILVVHGGYHGGVLYFASGAAPWNAPYEFVIAPYNDLAATLPLIDEHGRRPRGGARRADARLRRLHPGHARVPARAVRRGPQRRRGVHRRRGDDVAARAPRSRRPDGRDAPTSRRSASTSAAASRSAAFGGRADLMDQYDTGDPARTQRHRSRRHVQQQRRDDDRRDRGAAARCSRPTSPRRTPHAATSSVPASPRVLSAHDLPMSVIGLSAR